MECCGRGRPDAPLRKPSGRSSPKSRRATIARQAAAEEKNMGDVTFAVQARDSRGKGAARKLRAQGLVPGVVYGGGRESTPIALDAAGLERLLERSHSGVNTLIDLAGDSPVAG